MSCQVHICPTSAPHFRVAASLRDTVGTLSLERSQRLTTTDKPVTELPLTPEDFFVLSRIDGRATVGEIIAGSGLPSADAKQILDKLFELGAIEAHEAAPANGASARRERPVAGAKSRRAAMLRAQFASASGSFKRESRPNSNTAEPKPEPEPVKPDGMVRVDPVPLGDARLDASLDIAVDEQRILWATEDRLGDLSHFELLGISPTNDKKLIRSAYHLVSRKFHPDRYYNKNVGPLGPLLQSLFKRAKSSFEVLMKDELREAYVERFLDQRRREEAARTAAAESEARAAAARKRAEDEMKALEAQVASKERAKRDQDRKAKQQRRIATANRAKRGGKAKELYDQAIGQMKLNPGNAANLFRLALDLDPGNEEYEQHWKRCLREARVERGAKAFTQGARLEEMGQVADAARLYLEAAEADPIAPHLAEAAFFIRDDDPGKARTFAMQALDAMAAAEAAGEGLSLGRRGRVLLCAGHAFLAAGQTHSAREQANAAHAVLGERPDVRALLNLLKKA